MLRHFKKIIIQLRLAFVRDTAKRHAMREALLKKINNSDIIKEEVAKKKWGVSYSIFDGEELLEASINSLRSCVDYVNVVYQDISWFGKTRESSILPMLEELKTKGLIDEIIFFTPDMKMVPKRMERKKRNLGLKHAKKAKCDYFMSLDCDEFFIAPQMEAAKQEIVRKRITHSYCPFVTYGMLPTQRYLDIGYCIPFFSEVRFYSFLSASLQRAVVRIDPTRGMARLPFYNNIYFITSCPMHHMTYIRKDYQCKIDNSATLGVLDLKAEDFSYSRGDVIVEDIFNIEDFNPELIKEIREKLAE